MSYFRDWFGRDADYGYTYYDPYKRSMGWDKGYTDYSDFFFGKGKKVDMSEAAKLITTMSRVVGIDKSKFKATRGAEGAQIPAHMLKEGISTDVFIGASLHNVAQYVHQSAEERRDSLSLTMGKSTVAKYVAKILNDERVNKLMAEDTPGYLRFIQKYKEHKYKDRPAHANDGQHLMDVFDRIMRYPDQLTEEELEKFKEPIAEVKDYISKAGGVPTDFKKCMSLSSKIAKVLQKFVEEQEKEEEEDKGDGGSGAGGGSGGGAPSTSSSSVKEQLKSMEEFAKKSMDAMLDKSEDATSAFGEFMEELKHNEETSKADVVSKVDYIPVAPTAPAIYECALKEMDMTKASVLGTLLRRKSRDYQFSLKSMRSGRLDTNKLAEAVQGVSTIYERFGEVKTNKLCVAVLVDESGSMGGYKEEAARKAAIFLNESLKGVHDVELFIYGHTADWGGGYEGSHGIARGSCSGGGSTQLLIYKEPGITTSNQLGHMSAKYENRDGAAIIAAAKRVRSKTQSNGVFVVISDGSPHAQGYSGRKAKDHVRRMAIATEQLGFEVIQVTIGGYRSTDMFKNVIDIDNVSEFPEKFIGFLKKKVNSMIKEKTIL